MNSNHLLRQCRSCCILLFTTILCLPALRAQTLIASYPLTVNNNDATGNFGPMLYGSTATQAPNACGDGTVNGYIVTPNMASRLNTSNFQITVTFTVRNFQSSGGARAVFMLDNSYRTFGVCYSTTGELGLYWNNSNFAPSSRFIVTNQTYTVMARYVAPHAEVYLNGQLIQSMNINAPLEFNPGASSYRVATYNGANGQYADGCYSNLLVYSGNVTLPVTLASFRAEGLHNNQVLLQWESEHEFDGERFAIERSQDAREWTEIGNRAARGLNTSSAYSFVDEAPVPDRINYYRLRYEHQTGEKSYTAVEKIQMGSHAAVYKVYPNPVTDVLTILNWHTTGVVKVFEPGGRAVMSLPVNADGKADVRQLKAGMYLLEI